jgi:hypothetical protein
MTEGHLLTGNFADKPFPVLLVEIKDAAKSGILIAQKGEIVKRVFFRSGEPVVCRSNVKKELLGEILRRRGVLSRAQLDEAILESKKESIDNFGQILVRKGFLSPQELYDKSKYQFISILFSLFAWEEGSYTFEEKDADSAIPTTLPRFHLQFTKLISEGIRLLKKEDFVDRLLGDPGQMVRRSLLEIPSDEMSFKGQEQTVLEAMGSGKSIEALADAGVLDPCMAKKILYALSCLGAVVLQPPAAVDSGAAAAALAGVASEEALPSLDESSLSSMISEMQVDEPDAGVPAEMPVTDEALEDLSVSEIAGEGIEVDELLAPQEGGEGLASEFDEATDKIDAAVAQVGEALAEEPLPAPDDVPEGPPLEALLSESAETEPVQSDEAAEEVFSVAAIDEALVSEPPVEEPLAPTAGAVGEEAAADETAMEDELASLEAVLPGAAPEEPGGEEPAPLPPEPDAVLAGAVENEAGEAAAKPDEETPFRLKYRRNVRPARKGFPLLIGALLGGVALLFGGIAFYYSHRSNQAGTETPGKSEQAQALVPLAETKTAAQIIEELTAEGVGKQEAPGSDTVKTVQPDEPPATETEGKIVSGPGIKIVSSPAGPSKTGTDPDSGGAPSVPAESAVGAGAEPAKTDTDSEKPVAPETETAAPVLPKPGAPEKSAAEPVVVAKETPPADVAAKPAPEAPSDAKESPPPVLPKPGAPEKSAAEPVTAAKETPPADVAAKPAPAAPAAAKESPPPDPVVAPPQKTVSAKVEAPAPPSKSAKVADPGGQVVVPPAKPLQDWGTYYAKGLAIFSDGNLKTAFAAWADVIRAAPPEAFSIQIELTSYLNYASKDLKTALPNEKVFIVMTSLNDKPVYKVLCGIYPDEETAKTALAALSPYLKAQKPVVVSLVRLKEKLAKYGY